MVIQIIAVLSLIIFASVLQSNYKIPTPITIMTIVMIALFFNIKIINIDSTQFDNLVFITLPLLIASDAFKLKLNDIFKNFLTLFWVAVVGVLAFIFFGVIFNKYILINYNLSLPAITLLFCMVAATDPITVSSVFSNFKVPYKLKLITEGESLFNDATALIVFAIALMALNNPLIVNSSFITYTTFSVIFGAISIGLFVGVLTIWLLKISEEAFIESSIILLSSYFSYWLTEHFHFSGILAVIVTILIANNTISKIITKDNKQIEEASNSNNFGLLKYAITNKENYTTILKSMEFLSMFASTILFASIASIVKFEYMFKYKYEILAVFIASTIIRGLTMIKFAIVSHKIEKMQSIKKHWLSVLTFAGSKGALSILMVHMIPNTFRYKSLFEQIIIGNIILSTFIYAIFLFIFFKINKKKFEQECLEDLILIKN